MGYGTKTLAVGIAAALAVCAGPRQRGEAAAQPGPPDVPSTAGHAAPQSTPLGLPPVPVPSDNPMTSEKIELGKLLYFDPRLSKDGTVSCATCHEPKEGWSERRATSKGIRDQIGERNSPTVINSAYHREQFWDGHAATLEEQALGPIEDPIEMGHKLEDLVKELAAIPEYARRFREVFGTEVTREGIGRAIAAFERAIELNPATPNVAYNLGLIHRDRDEVDKALYWFQRALQTNPNDGDARSHIEKLRYDGTPGAGGAV